jgi:hypothetical protein
LLLSNPTRCFVTVESGHADVEQDDIRWKCRCRFDRFESVVRSVNVVADTFNSIASFLAEWRLSSATRMRREIVGTSWATEGPEGLVGSPARRQAENELTPLTNARAAVFDGAAVHFYSGGSLRNDRNDQNSGGDPKSDGQE